MRIFNGLAAAACILALGSHARAEIETEDVPYEHDGVSFVGYLARPAERDGERPGILVVHEWWGLNDYVRQRTRDLAEMGYIAFAADVYGEGKATDDPEQAGAWAGAVRGDRDLFRDRLQAALDTLAESEGVDDDRFAVIGFCFGGTGAVEIGYASDDIDGVVSFHGNPMPARDSDDDIEARFLILHGDADPMVSDEDLQAFADPLDERGVDYRIVRYEGALHAFTNPAADVLDNDAVGYHAEAAEQSWLEMQTFFDEIFDEDKMP